MTVNPWPFSPLELSFLLLKSALIPFLPGKDLPRGTTISVWLKLIIYCAQQWIFTDLPWDCVTELKDNSMIPILLRVVKYIYFSIIGSRIPREKMESVYSCHEWQRIISYYILTTALTDTWRDLLLYAYV